MDYKEEEENIPDCRLSNVIQLQRRRIAKKCSDESSLEVGRTLWFLEAFCAQNISFWRAYED